MLKKVKDDMVYDYKTMTPFLKQ